VPTASSHFHFCYSHQFLLGNRQEMFDFRRHAPCRFLEGNRSFRVIDL
jgi:hypothetical protein